jgi:hypothetical protein
MSEAIWKFPLEVTQAVQKVSMPKGARILHAGLQDGKLAFWAEVVQSAEKETRRFLVVGTGWELPPDRNYVGTVQAPPFVWHIYEYRRAGGASPGGEG